MSILYFKQELIVTLLFCNDFRCSRCFEGSGGAYLVTKRGRAWLELRLALEHLAIRFDTSDVPTFEEMPRNGVR
jgi:hypothetical protein